MKQAARRSFRLIPVVAGVCACSLFGSVAGLPGDAATPADAGTIYNRDCASCHGRDGRSRTRKGRQTRARDMTNPEWQDDVSDERLCNSVSNGRGKMPAFQMKISESDIDALVVVVRRLRR